MDCLIKESGATFQLNDEIRPKLKEGYAIHKYPTNEKEEAAALAELRLDAVIKVRWIICPIASSRKPRR